MGYNVNEHIYCSIDLLSKTLKMSTIGGTLKSMVKDKSNCLTEDQRDAVNLIMNNVNYVILGLAQHLEQQNIDYIPEIIMEAIALARKQC